MGKERGKYLTELRRSNAAGLHNQRPTRSAFNRAAIEEQLEDEELSYQDLIYSCAEELAAEFGTDVNEWLP